MKEEIRMDEMCKAKEGTDDDERWKEINEEGMDRKK
jgi:hypothetical protein